MPPVSAVRLQLEGEIGKRSKDGSQTNVLRMKPFVDRFQIAVCSLRLFPAHHWVEIGPTDSQSETGGEGGIRTHGTVTRTTVFEFYDSHAGRYRPVTKRAL